MDILFCDNPLDNKTVDPDFTDEFTAANENGFTIHLFSFEQLTREGNIAAALRKIKPTESIKPIIYRGWMLKPKQYSLLYDALLSKNYKLVNSPTEYQSCHYFPDSYKFIHEHTPKSIWLTVRDQQVDYDQLFEKIAEFGNSPLIIKDFVKSQKHYWDTACFIPSAADKDRVRSVVERFLELQNTDLNEGLVIRQFVELEDLAIHSKSGMPLRQEYRLFFLNGQLAGCYDYWEEGEYIAGEKPPLDQFMDIAKKVESNFFSMDVAKTKTGKWIIIELGDGQVAGVPEKAGRQEFYSLIGEMIN